MIDNQSDAIEWILDFMSHSSRQLACRLEPFDSFLSFFQPNDSLDHAIERIFEDPDLIVGIRLIQALGQITLTDTAGCFDQLANRLCNALR